MDAVGADRCAALERIEIRSTVAAPERKEISMIRFRPSHVVLIGAMVVLLAPRPSWAATPSVEQALKLMPVQPGVDYDRPSPEEAAKCKIVAKKIDGHVGWIVESPDGVILRKFVDTNDDNVVDQWSYYKDGLEVYRDIDSNYNGKADQYRWFHTGGSRWGLDPNEDGVIESWKSISAEEVTAEVVAAIATHDAERFARLVLTPAELRSLGLGKARAESVAEKVAQGHGRLQDDGGPAKGHRPRRRVGAVQRRTGRASCPPEPTNRPRTCGCMKTSWRSSRAAESTAQVQIGTLVQVGDAWRVIDLPQPMAEGQADASPSGFFFQASMTRPQRAGRGGAERGVAETAGRPGEPRPRGGQGRPRPRSRPDTPAAAPICSEQIAAAAKTADDRGMWLRQLADMISAAVQAGTCPDGAERLKALFEKLQKSDADKNLAAYVKFRQLTAAYVLSMQAPKADFAKIQAEWLKTLEQYIADYPTAPDAAEAMLQLAISQEFAGQEDEAKKWYARIVTEFPDSPAARKAAGARPASTRSARRSSLSGQSPLGSPVDLAKYRGKVVLIQYWATWSAAGQGRHGHAQGDVEQVRPVVHDHRRQPRQQREGPERLPGRESAALAADLRGRRPGQPPGQRAGHPHRADDDPGGPAGQGRQPQRLDRRSGVGDEEADPVAESRLFAGAAVVDGWGGSCTAALFS